MHRPVDHYSPIAIALHWSVAALIICVLVLGFVIRRAPIGPSLQFELFQWHKSFGLLALLLSVVRLLHSAVLVRVAPMPSLSRVERHIAKTVHVLLLVMAVAVPFAGWLVASASPLEIPTFAFNAVVVPHLPVPKSEGAEAWWATLHSVLAYGMLSLVFVHSAASLHHHYLRRDPVLRRMLGRRRILPQTSFREHGP